ncbi:MAG: hypothetical protein J7513_09940 [Solirubrobacteraceae bacterium]|nr:hypothetical protein [Solirubrobacteraceae bacterium]
MPGAEAAPPGAGWCAACAHLRVIRSGRGSVFVMCERGLRKEAGFVKYPRLPVTSCSGYEAPADSQA